MRARAAAVAAVAASTALALLAPAPWAASASASASSGSEAAGASISAMPVDPSAWSTLVPLTDPGDGAAHDAEVGVTALGETVAAWIRDSPAGPVAEVAHRSPTGTAWLPSVASPTGVEVAHVDLAVGADGTAVLLMAGTAGGSPLVQARVRRPGAAWSPPATLDQLAVRAPATGSDGAPIPALDADAGADGTATAAWVAADGRVRAAVLPAGSATWSPTQDAGGGTGGPEATAVRVDAVTLPGEPGGTAATAAATFTLGTPGAEAGVVVARRPSSTWSTVSLTGTDDPLPVTAAGPGPGELLIAWLDRSASPSRVRAARLPAAGGAATATPVSPSDRTAGGPALAVAEDGAAVLAWAQDGDGAGGSPWSVATATRPAGGTAWDDPVEVPGSEGTRAGGPVRATAALGGVRSVVADRASGGALAVLAAGGAWGAPAQFDEPATASARTVGAPDGQVTLLAGAGAGPTRAVLAATTSLPAPTARTSPAVTGSPALGSTLACDPGIWARASSLSYAWFRDGLAVPGRTTATYAVGTGDPGTSLACRVTATNTAGTTVATSPPRPVPGPPTPSGAPTLSDPVRVGQQVTCVPPAYSPAATGLAYQWFRDGTPLVGATNAGYVPRAADRRRALQCRIDATGDGGTSSALAEARTVAAGVRLDNVRRPVIEGKRRVGADVRCAVGGWEPAQTDVRVRWLVRGKALRRVHVPRLRVPTQARGARLTCVVTASRPGHPDGSARSRPVRIGRG